MSMDCPFLSVNHIFTCSAKTVYAPSGFQIEEYCRNKRKRYSICPFFRFRDEAKKLKLVKR
jgi:hypothetical protein